MQRIITDEPVGVLVGFRMSDEELEALGAEADEWGLVFDDGGKDSIPVLLDWTKNDVAIRPRPVQEELDAGLSPLGMDLVVFRSRDELVEYLTE